MCGIVGIISEKPVAANLVSALRRLEYRGYDSAGIATLERGRLVRRRAEGKLGKLEDVLRLQPLSGRIGIGHTRWATHGKPTAANAHPHATEVVAVVHNGIIENFRELRQELEALGTVFESQTDTEVVTHLVSRKIRAGMNRVDAVLSILPRLRGAFALVFMFDGDEDLLIGARRGSPLAVGYGKDEMFFGSDALALASLTEKISYLEEGDIAVVRRDSVEFLDEEGLPIVRDIHRIAPGSLSVERGHHRHFMAKEIHEQPDVIGKTLSAYINFAAGDLMPLALPFDWRKLERITIAACGTAYYAGLVAKHWFEQFAQIPVEIDLASEFRYRHTPMPETGLMLLVSQSGETADTLACLRLAKARKQHVATVVNVMSSTMARESDVAFPIFAGPEIGVASTKAFTCQLTALLALALHAGRDRGALSEEQLSGSVYALGKLPGLMQAVLALEPKIEAIAKSIRDAADVIYLGRGTSHPLALEGALKLKEISYIHAEGFAAGELKHGPIALIDENVPVIVTAPTDHVLEKTISNVQEVAARGAKVIVLGDARSVESLGVATFAELVMPECDPALTPILYALPLQLIAYHTASALGKDVDQPRNLAKSVTVE